MRSPGTKPMLVTSYSRSTFIQHGRGGDGKRSKYDSVPSKLERRMCVQEIYCCGRVYSCTQLSHATPRNIDSYLNDRSSSTCCVILSHPTLEPPRWSGALLFQFPFFWLHLVLLSDNAVRQRENKLRKMQRFRFILQPTTRLENPTLCKQRFEWVDQMCAGASVLAQHCSRVARRFLCGRHGQSHFESSIQ